MKRRWIKIAISVMAILALSIAAVFAWLSWPNSSTMVDQAIKNDIPDLKRSLFLGADINGYSYWGWHGENKGETPLTSAVTHGNLETVKFLLSRGADPNQPEGGDGMPPICTAAIHGRLDVCQALIEAGAKADDFYPPSKKKPSITQMANAILKSQNISNQSPLEANVA